MNDLEEKLADCAWNCCVQFLLTLIPLAAIDEMYPDAYFTDKVIYIVGMAITFIIKYYVNKYYICKEENN